MSEFSNDSAEAIEQRFQDRVMTRTEYTYWYRMQRRSDYLYKCPYLPEWRPNTFTSHLSKAHDHVRTLKALKGTHYQDMYAYNGVGDAYREYVDLAIADYGGCLYEAELERAAEMYHMGYSVVVEFRP